MRLGFVDELFAPEVLAQIDERTDGAKEGQDEHGERAHQTATLDDLDARRRRDTCQLDTPVPDDSVKFDPLAGPSGVWEDELGRNWTNAVRFDLPDRDVFRSTRSPTRRSSRRPSRTSARCSSTWSSTRRRQLYVSNTEARNEVRFEGPGTLRAAPRCAAICTRRASPSSTATNVAAAPSQQAHRRAAAGLPHDADAAASRRPAWPRRSTWRWRATARCTSPPSARARWACSTPPSSRTTPSCPMPRVTSRSAAAARRGLALDEAHHRLYVLTRFDNAVKVIDTTTAQRDRQHLRCTIPSRRRCVDGRRFLYDARFTSSNGEASCASCHVFADFDSLAWDLGNPDDDGADQPEPVRSDRRRRPVSPAEGADDDADAARPGEPGPDALARRSHRRHDPSRRAQDAFDEQPASRRSTSPSSLLGRDEGQISDADMKAFTDFVAADRAAAQSGPQPRQSAHRARRPTAARLFLDRAAHRQRRALRRLSHARRGAGALRHRG